MSTESPRFGSRGTVTTRERIYGDATSSRDGRQALVAAFFAVSVFLLLLALSTRQATAAAPAERVISAGIAATTDLDQLLAEEREPVRQLAQNSTANAIAVPGYPLDVFLTRDEALNATTPQIRAAILERSSALVYTRGLSAFDRTGHQSISRFSSQGIVDVAVSQVSDSTHSRASLGSVIFALMAAASGCTILATNSGWGRLRTLGIATLFGAGSGFLVFALGWLIIGQLDGSDTYTSELREIARTTITVPLRNFGIVTALGAIVTAAGIVFARIEGRTAAEDGANQSALDDEFERYSAGTGA